GGGVLGALVAERSVVVCCGPGGVGKTTTAATLALEGARRGRRSVVVTVDPARRLADALGLDTPPTRNALDFVDAPRRLVRLLDNRIFRLLMLPARAGVKAVNVAAQALLRTISRVVGSEVVNDAVQFFQAFEGMEDGFRDRAQRVDRLLSDPGTAFLLVAGPRPDIVVEADFFADRLAEAGIPVAALVVNRMHPRYGGEWSEVDRERARTLAGTPLGPLYENLADLHQVADGEEAHVAHLIARVAPAPAVRVPVLAGDVHDLDGLTEVATHLFGPPHEPAVDV
ncbi:MAG TPA: ArsA-related P-loop ATPase, partial [Acidimicrobiales bacterium]|nr:ArsA-related P-loop ATPase [Acidimicrobiales bacterium]